MSLTVGQIADKISEIRSKIAIQEGLMLYLQANYKSSDAGAAEMHFTRHDFATVPEDHIDRFVDDVVDALDELRMELKHWEDMPVGGPPAKKGKKRAGTRRHQDHAASEGDRSEEVG